MLHVPANGNADRRYHPDRLHALKDDAKDDKKAEATPTPKPEKKVKTPYAGNYTKQSLSYESSSKAISFETTTLDGSSTGSSLFSKNRITMVNIWTRT